jgi:uncharacterized membrane protein YccC
VAIGGALLFFVSNNTVLVGIMIICMLMAYSLLRVNYLAFVGFLTIYVLITFHFFDPGGFRNLIGERLLDTFIGSVIAAIAARFIFPVWQQHNILPAIKKMLLANTTYFMAAWNILNSPGSHKRQYRAARNDAIVALTNLSDYFQQMLAEPERSEQYSLMHQLVIACHTLTSRISSLTSKEIAVSEVTQLWFEKIIDSLEEGAVLSETIETVSTKVKYPSTLPSLPTLHPLPIIFSLSKDIRSIAARIMTASPK